MSYCGDYLPPMAFHSNPLIRGPRPMRNKTIIFILTNMLKVPDTPLPSIQPPPPTTHPSPRHLRINPKPLWTPAAAWLILTPPTSHHITVTAPWLDKSRPSKPPTAQMDDLLVYGDIKYFQLLVTFHN